MDAEDIKRELQEIKAAIQAPQKQSKQKDKWDKFSIVSSFVSSVLIAAIGLTYTYMYNKRESLKNEQAEQFKKKITELELITKIIPQLASKDKDVKSLAKLTLEATFKSASNGTKDGITETFMKLAQKKGITNEEKVAVTKTIIAIAKSNEVPQYVKEKATDAMVTIAKDNNAPLASREIALKGLMDMKLLKPEQVSQYLADLQISRQIDEITIHHSKQPSASEYSGAKTIENMAKYHIADRGFAEVAWHFAVAPNGDIWKGRDLQKIGAGVIGHNQKSIYVELILDGDNEMPSLEQKRSAGILIVCLLNKFGLKAGDTFNSEKGFHRDYDRNKTCPGNNITKELVLQWISEYSPAK